MIGNSLPPIKNWGLGSIELQHRLSTWVYRAAFCTIANVWPKVIDDWDWGLYTYHMHKAHFDHFIVPRLTKWGRGTIEFAIVCLSVRPSVNLKLESDLRCPCPTGLTGLTVSTPLLSRLGTLELRAHWYFSCNDIPFSDLYRHSKSLFQFV